MKDIQKLTTELQLADDKVNALSIKNTSLADYFANDKIWEIHVRRGWFGARLSMSGYTDATSWAVFPTEEQAKAFLKEEESLSHEED